MKNQPRFNRFAKAHFIGKEHAWRHTAANLLGDVQLVGDQVDSATNKAAHWRLPPAVHHLQCTLAQCKNRRVIHVSAAQPVHWSVYADTIVKLCLGQFPTFAAIGDNILLITNAIYNTFGPTLILDRFSGTKCYPP